MKDILRQPEGLRRTINFLSQDGRPVLDAVTAAIRGAWHAWKTTTRRIRDRKRAEAILESLSKGKADICEGYRALYSLWCSNNSAVPELRPLFRIPGIEPDGHLSVTDSFRAEVRSLSAQILQLISDSKTEAS